MKIKIQLFEYKKRVTGPLCIQDCIDMCLPTIRKLDLNHCEISNNNDDKLFVNTLDSLEMGGSKDNNGIIKVLKCFRNIRSLNLQHLKFDNDMWVQLVDILKMYTLLQKLVLEYCNMNDDSCILLSNVIKNTPVLKILNLFYNRIGDKGCIALADALKVNTSLTYLNLDSNKMRDKGLIAIADALKVNTSISCLHLDTSNKKILDNGYIALADALRINRSLTHLSLLLHKNLDSETIRLVANALITNNVLERLHLSIGNIGNKGYKVLYDEFILKNDLTKSQLNMIIYAHKLSKYGNMLISSLLKHTTVLKKLYVTVNYPKLFAKGIKANTSLIHLNLYSYDSYIPVIKSLKYRGCLKGINIICTIKI